MFTSCHHLAVRSSCYLVLTALICQISPSVSIRWLGLSSISSVGSSGADVMHEHSGHVTDTRDHCDLLRGSLARQQINFCKKYPSFMGAVKMGALSAINECQSQFRDRRWNCSTSVQLDQQVISKKIRQAIEELAVRTVNKNKQARSASSRQIISPSSGEGKGPSEPQNDQPQPQKRTRNPLDSFGPYPIVPPGTREAAFVHAISAAGVAHALTRACSSGSLEDCSCDQSVRGLSSHGFQWSGCSDNVAYGTSLTKMFVDSKEQRGMRKWRKKSMMNVHNNEVGRKILERNMKIECKCHGVSGSCELKTCWKRMPTFRNVGAILKQKFEEAVRVRRRRTGTRYKLVSRAERKRDFFKSDLVYITKSPSFCEFHIDQREVSIGTEQRQCNASSRGMDGCDALCCGRGYRSQRVTIMQQCHCKFTWCCTVRCQQCARQVDVHTCL